MAKKVRKFFSKLGFNKKTLQIGRWVGRIASFLILLVLVVAGFLWVHRSLYAARVMELENIRIEGIQKLTPKEVITLSHLKKGANLFEIDLDRMLKAVSAHPWVRTASFKKVFPNRLEVRIVERTPVFEIYSPQAGLFFLIDDEGALLPEGQTEHFANYLEFQDVKLVRPPAHKGERYESKHLKTIANFIQNFEDKDFFIKQKINKIQVDEIGFWTFVTEDGIEFQLGEDLGNIKKLDNFGVLLNSEVRQTLDYLDLRFQDVVVKIKKKDTKTANVPARRKNP